MIFLRVPLVLAFALIGCSISQQPAVTLTPYATDVVKKGVASKEDILAALTAAKHSKYFPGTDRYELGPVVSQDQIDVMYYDVAGTYVIVKRIHGRWTVVGSGFWSSK